MAANPWAPNNPNTGTLGVAPEYPDQLNSAYAVPSSGRGAPDAPYNDEFGWAPHMRKVPGSTPDPYRLGSEPLREHYPNPQNGEPPEVYYGSLDADKARRASVQQVTANGWDETKEGFGYPTAAAGAHRFADNPRATPPPETRVTQRRSPRSYSFVRPFLTDTPKISARRFNGLHFSMADHSRNYEILGMAPPRSWRNTYRLEPTPWDGEVTDYPAPSAVVAPQVISPNPEAPSRSWRLS